MCKHTAWTVKYDENNKIILICFYCGEEIKKNDPN